MELYATVTNRDGRPVANLDADDFEVREGGRLQTLVRFERVEDIPLNLGFIIDTSGSMLQSIAETQRAASGFLSRILRPQDRSFVIGVASRPFQLFAPTGDAEAMTRADLPELRAAGKTSLYDGVATAVSLLREGRGQRAIVLLSDGRDTTSHAFLQQVMDFARNGRVTVYAVGLGLLDERIEMDSARGILAQLAAATGGRVYFIARAEQLEEVYDRIGEDLRSRYLLTYQTENGDEERSRRAEVRVKKRGLKVRTAWRGNSP